MANSIVDKHMFISNFFEFLQIPIFNESRDIYLKSQIELSNLDLRLILQEILVKANQIKFLLVASKLGFVTKKIGIKYSSNKCLYFANSELC